MENLLKAHTNFESRLKAQEERVKTFSEAADQLIAANVHANAIELRRAEVLTKFIHF